MDYQYNCFQSDAFQNPDFSTYRALSGSLSLLCLLALSDSSLTCGSTDFRLLCTLGTDGVPGSTDDSAVVLDSTTRALLGNLLRNALLVHATVDNSPVDLARVQTLQEIGLALAVNETERLLDDTLVS
jgi:hypothetical protein